MSATVVLRISDNQGYSADQVETRVTLADMLAAVQTAIEEFGEDAKVVTANNQRYGAKYGRISTSYGEVELESSENED